MLLMTMALIGAMAGEPEQEDAGRWRILREGAAGSIAFQLGERPPRAGDYGTAYLLTTYAQPQPMRAGGTYRQRWVELSIECPHEGDAGHYGDVWDWVAQPDTPFPTDQISPPIAVRSFDDNRFGPLALAICNGEGADKPLVEGDWATVLKALLARADARLAG